MSLLRRILISQDRDEIFVTIASYSAEYVQFLRGTGAAHQDFLTLQEYGPWLIYSRKDMRQFGHIIVAICIAISDEEREDREIDVVMEEASPQ